VPARDIDPAAGPEGKRAARVRPNRTGVGVAQGRELPPETMLRAGVCVIGTGAGGVVAAARLAEAGHEVVLLEEGGYYTAADFTEEEGPMTARLYAEGGTRATNDLSVAVFQGRSVGSGTIVTCGPSGSNLPREGGLRLSSACSGRCSTATPDGSVVGSLSRRRS
jgi:hypothetical protein